ncbi:MAG: hypothetical protein LBR22_00870 [Desulfovibrio sp.]|jgi:hypothetical protein|nr:hypothetical protein [Desulfovibrio sp.]
MELDPEIKARTENFYMRTLQKGMQEGLQEGIQECLLIAVAKRFPKAPESLIASIRCIHGSDRLLALVGEFATSKSLKAFTNALNMTLKQQASMQ